MPYLLYDLRNESPGGGGVKGDGCRRAAAPSLASKGHQVLANRCSARATGDQNLCRLGRPDSLDVLEPGAG